MLISLWFLGEKGGYFKHSLIYNMYLMITRHFIDHSFPSKEVHIVERNFT